MTPDGVGDGDKESRAQGIEIDRETVTDMGTLDNYYCVQLEGLLEGVTYQWAVRVYYLDNVDQAYKYGPRAPFRQFTYRTDADITPTVDPAFLTRPQNLHGRDISRNLDSDNPDIWVLLRFEGHRAAQTYHVQRWIDEGDFQDYIGMDEYRVHTHEHDGTFVDLYDPPVRNNNANIICESVLVPTAQRDLSQIQFDSAQRPCPPPINALSRKRR